MIIMVHFRDIYGYCEISKLQTLRYHFEVSIIVKCMSFIQESECTPISMAILSNHCVPCIQEV